MLLAAGRVTQPPIDGGWMPAACILAIALSAALSISLLQLMATSDISALDRPASALRCSAIVLPTSSSRVCSEPHVDRRLSAAGKSWLAMSSSASSGTSSRVGGGSFMLQPPV